MKKILYIPSDTKGGVYYYRTYTPMKQLAEDFGELFDVTVANGMTFSPQDFEYAAGFDILIAHNGLFTAEAQDRFWKMVAYCRNKGVKTVLDLDDYWDYGTQHPAYEACRFNAFPEKMMINFKLFEYVTTTTDYFAGVITRRFPAERVRVFPNAIARSDAQFSEEKDKSPYLRIGLTGGSSHTSDIKQLLDLGRFLNDKQLDNIELVLCGYDPNGKQVDIDENGRVVGSRDIDEKDNWWFQTELAFKKTFRHYRRVNTASILNGEYGGIYRGIDVLLVPLNDTEFNACKSELKFIEAGFTGTAVIASNVKPYSLWGENGEDCVLVKRPNAESWASAVKKICNQKGLLEKIRINNMKKIKAKRSLEDVTEKRAEFFSEIA